MDNSNIEDVAVAHNVNEQPSPHPHPEVEEENVNENEDETGTESDSDYDSDISLDADFERAENDEYVFKGEGRGEYTTDVNLEFRDRPEIIELSWSPENGWRPVYPNP